MGVLWRFGNAAVDLSKVWAAEGDMVLMEGGNWCHIGKAAVKALVEAMPVYRAKAGRTETPRQDADETVKRSHGQTVKR